MIDKLREFENKPAEIVFSWKDSETEAEGWVVINSLRGGAAGGGTRMRKGLDLKEVLSLAKTMEIKFAISGPDIGGAKSGINFDPNDPRKNEVLTRWFEAVIPLLKYYYGTGGDLNIDEIKDVMPITSKLRLLHPQEGIVSGHLKSHGEAKRKVIKQLQVGVTKRITLEKLSPDNSHDYKVADLITGYGVAMSVLHYYKIWGSDYKNKKVIIQGFGNVGGPTAFYLAQAGMKIVSVTDREGGVISKEGFSLDEIKELLKKRSNNLITANSEKVKLENLPEKFSELKAEVFVPAAGSRLLDKDLLSVMLSNDLELIASGANVPFKDDEIFLGETALMADNQVSVIPDFIANCGMARVFAYLMKENAEVSEEAIFRDVSNRIKESLENVYKLNPEKTKISQTALDMVINQLNK